MSDPLAALPTVGARRVAVRVTKDALRHVRAGHPWVYDRSIRSVSHTGAPGDLAVVFDDTREFVAIGLWDPTSPIRLRILHAGDPTPIDRDWLASRVMSAIDRRAPLAADPGTDAYRLVHGENDGLPGLVIDRYDHVAVVKLYTAAWFPHLPALIAPLHGGPVVLRLARAVSAGPSHGMTDGQTIHGDPPAEPVRFRENGLTMECSPSKGQKTGYFLDQRDNRARVRDLAPGARVLDVFSCTGGFTVHAAAGGAASVHSVDISRHALGAVARNLAHNRLTTPHVATAGDAFAVMADLADEGKEFDVVIVDPPSFAPRQDRIPGALSAYRRLTAGAVALTSPGGTLVQASCSSRIDEQTFFATVHDAAAGSGAALHEIERTAHGVDHPVTFPEGAYLKALIARVDR